MRLLLKIDKLNNLHYLTRMYATKVASQSFSSTSALCVRTAITPSLSSNTSLNGYRYIRTRAPGADHGNNRNQTDKEEENKQDGDKKETSDSAGNENHQQKKLDPATVKKLRLYVLAVAGLSFVSSFLILANTFKDGSGIPDGVQPEHFNRQGIDFQSFVNRYLKTGEVRNIVFCPAQQRAIAFLHDGAIIDGKAVTDKVVVVSYSQNAQQFWADVRKEEALIGISLSNGVKIDLYQGLTTMKVVELLLGLFILAFLGTQYGRLLRKKMLENKAVKGGSTSSGKQ